ncbi:hypothetical protein [Nocardioides stalactiti]|uniref:hypothetical protein n=1 Tax=Nocardioides stalactiti TaxID=2755356 RepID=UPI0016030E62|nr:hypothetical protein [Nocardioides stalactiti]
MPPLTRGPLPAGVYWRRRLFVLALAATMVFVIGSVLTGGSDAKDDEVPTVQQAGAEVQASETITVPEKGRKNRKNRRTATPTIDPALTVAPEGNCDPADVRVTPYVDAATAGQPVQIGLSLQTVQADACYFRVGADKVTVKITKRGREIWTSRECADPVPDQSVVVRRVVATVVRMTWDARESDPDCTNRRSWLMPGSFTIAAATLGGEPAESGFDLDSPATETITVAPETEGGRTDGQDGGQQQTGGQQTGGQDTGGQQDDEQPSDAGSSKPPRR